jgi:TonB family protein
VDADNLAQIINTTLVPNSKKIEIHAHAEGIFQLLHFAKGSEISLLADGYNEEIYQRPDKRQEIAMKYNGEFCPESGDTIVVELLLKSELLNQRWAEEDALYPIGDTTSLVYQPDVQACPSDEQGFSKAVSSMLHFPKHVIDSNVQGTVLISAIVEIDGTCSQIRIQRSLDPYLDRIALRAVRSPTLPLMKPAMKNQHPVRSIITIPVNFYLN